MAYTNPQLQTRTTNTILLLKKWIADNSYESNVKEKYGIDLCECLDIKLKVAVKYVEMMQCYQFSVIGAEEPYNCLTEAELITVIEKSTAITLSKC